MFSKRRDKIEQMDCLSTCCPSVLGINTFNLAQELWNIELYEQP
jgi:hypothetical protein